VIFEWHFQGINGKEMSAKKYELNVNYRWYFLLDCQEEALYTFHFNLWNLRAIFLVPLSSIKT
jgi:hypothetical protein